jgi:hypothetical protein
MKLSIAAFTSFVGLLQVTTANFDVYEATESAVSEAYAAYAVFRGELDCDLVLNYPTSFWGGADDVSRGASVRCDPPDACIQADPSGIEEFEMH